MTAKKTSKRTSASRPRSRVPRASRRGPSPESVEAILAFGEVARRERVRWYLFGAQAVGAYGIPRTTGDIDITPDPGARPLSHLAKALMDVGFEPIVASEALSSRPASIR